MPKARDPHALLPTGPRAARRLFTNRVQETRHILDLLTAPAGSPLPLVMFYGVGGAGKTRLLDHLAQRCQARGLPWASVDLAELRDADQVLPALAAQLEYRHNVQFPSFKRVLAVLVARRGGGALAARLGEYVTSTGQSAADVVLDGLGLVPVVGQLAAVVKLAKGASQVAFKQAMQRKPFRDAMLKLGGEGELVELVEWTQEQLIPELGRRFAADLVTGLAPQPGQAGRGVLLLDTHEALWQDTKGGAATQDGWIRLLREYLHDQGVLIVMAGRDRLRWPEDWSETDARGRHLWLEQHLLGGLSARDALEFLHRADVEEIASQPFLMPEPLQAAILRVTNEQPDPTSPSQHHCYLLALCAEVVANTRAGPGEYPSPDEFSAVPAGDAAAEPLLRRFLRSLRNEQMVNWLEELSLTPRFDEGYALALDAGRQHVNARAGWERLRELSLLEEWEGGFLEMHAILRDALRKRVEPARAQAVHAWSARYWGEQAAEDDWIRRGHAWYHRRFVDHATALAEFAAARDAAVRQGDAESARHLAEWWEAVALADAPATLAQTQDLAVYGRTLELLTTGDRGANILRAIACYEATLHLWTNDVFPIEWANVQNRLGNVYLDLPTGDRAANMRRAITCFEAALTVRTEASAPIEWASTQHNLGAVYLDLPTGDRTENLQRAIACYEAALRVRTKAAFPVEWARTQNSLGLVYSNLPRGDRTENLRHAIACFEAALTARTVDETPVEWATAQNNLGTAYWSLPTGDRSANLRRAIAYFGATLQVRTEEAFPFEWAKTQNNLANVYLDFPTGDRTQNLQRAADHYDAALTILTESTFPMEWATARNNLGNVYLDLRLGDRAENLRHAIACFEAALRIQTEDAFPQEWAILQHNLGLAYSNLPTADAAADLHYGIACFEASLRVLTEDAFPTYWAETQRELSRCYLLLAPFAGSSALDRARACCDAALRVYNQERYPNEWARLMMLMGNVYRALATVDEAALAHTVRCYEAALTVQTETDSPAAWAETHYELGRALTIAGEHERARAAFTAAARGYRSVGLDAPAQEADDAGAALPARERTG